MSMSGFTGTALEPGVFVAVVGPSGAGKDSILAGAKGKLPADGQVVFVRRVITRKADATEDHLAVDAAEFARMKEAGAFAFHWEAHDLSYALPASILDDIEAGRTVAANVSRAMIPALRKRFRRVLVVSISAPEHVLAARLVTRGRESARERAERVARSVGEFTADIRIENAGQLADAVREFADALTAVSMPDLQAWRYAIYLAPPRSSRLWQAASEVIGYDAASSLRQGGFCLPGIAEEPWSQLTRAPAQYGFHATLKAPFRLAPDRSAQSLIERMTAFCSRSSPFSLGRLSVRPVDGDGDGGFVALVPVCPPPELAELEREVVTRFDEFRAPLTDTEFQRRRPERLTLRQRELLEAYGYPHVLDQFRCHFTLTGPTLNAPQIAAALEDHFKRKCGPIDFDVDALVLFAQQAPGARFRIIRRFPFRAVA